MALHVAAWDVAPAAIAVVVVMLLIQQIGGEGKGGQRVPPAVVMATISVPAPFGTPVATQEAWTVETPVAKRASASRVLAAPLFSAPTIVLVINLDEVRQTDAK
ncbi:MAG: hypothetical protein GKR99_01680 [Rhodobacteraceae bacterium]|nr:hypothetical protein [Paracoccaceae bacterium]